jgi:hypothetical protein
MAYVFADIGEQFLLGRQCVSSAALDVDLEVQIRPERVKDAAVLVSRKLNRPLQLGLVSLARPTHTTGETEGLESPGLGVGSVPIDQHLEGLHRHA